MIPRKRINCKKFDLVTKAIARLRQTFNKSLLHCFYIKNTAAVTLQRTFCRAENGPCKGLWGEQKIDLAKGFLQSRKLILQKAFCRGEN